MKKNLFLIAVVDGIPMFLPPLGSAEPAFSHYMYLLWILSGRLLGARRIVVVRILPSVPYILT